MFKKILFILSLLFFFPAVSLAEIVEIDSCGELAQEGTTYLLTKDIVIDVSREDSPLNCFHIPAEAKGVTLDCQGHSITGTGYEEWIVYERDLLPGEEVFRMELQPGWNLISSPLKKDFTLQDIQDERPTVFGGVEYRKCEVKPYKDYKMWTYDAEEAVWENPESVGAGDAVYVYSSRYCDFTVAGYPAEFEGRKLVDGWNLISASQSFESVKQECETEEGYIWDLGANEQWNEYSLATPMDPTRGYWVNVKNSCSLQEPVDFFTEEEETTDTDYTTNIYHNYRYPGAAIHADCTKRHCDYESNITIQNCVIKNWQTGVGVGSYIKNSGTISGVHLNNLEIFSCGNYPRTQISEIEYPGINAGVLVAKVGGLTLDNVTVGQSAYGLSSVNGYMIERINSSNFSDNKGHGVRDANVAILENSTANSNGGSGFSGRLKNVENCQANFNKGSGFDQWVESIKNSEAKENKGGAITAYVEAVENVTGVDGLPIKFIDKSNTVLDGGEFEQVILFKADNSVVKNISPKGAAGFYIWNTNDADFQNLSSVSFPGSNAAGFYLYGSQGNAFKDCTVTDHSGQAGFQISASKENSFTDCVSKRNEIGFILGHLTIDNSFVNCVASENKEDGIYMGSAGNRFGNEFIGLTAANNGFFGINMGGNKGGTSHVLSHNGGSNTDNIFTDCVLDNNGSGAFRFTSTSHNYSGEPRWYSGQGCSTEMNNVTANGLEVKFIGEKSEDVNGGDFHQIILCDADGSAIRNAISQKKMSVLATSEAIIENVQSEGIEVCLSDNNVFKNSVFSNSDGDSTKISIFSSHFNVFDGCTIGGLLMQGSYRNTVKNSSIGPRGYFGILKKDALAGSCHGLADGVSDWPNYEVSHCPNYFYNNIISGNKPVVYNIGNAWSVGGVGNYWEGFSETCADADSDGICDIGYNVGGTNIPTAPGLDSPDVKMEGGCTDNDSNGLCDCNDDNGDGVCDTCYDGDNDGRCDDCTRCAINVECVLGHGRFCIPRLAPLNADYYPLSVKP